jgi:MoxR-like ATPase
MKATMGDWLAFQPEVELPSRIGDKSASIAGSAGSGDGPDGDADGTGRFDGERRVHLFEESAWNAVVAAIGTERPLLLRGEPGVGKTQMAEAVAARLQRALVWQVLDARTEPRELLYQVDAVRRLSEAQLCAATHGNTAEGIKKAREVMAPERFVVPGRIWWAFNHNTAATQSDRAQVSHDYPADHWKGREGTVLLIDEIDKAEAEVPNALLEALGERRFSLPFGMGQVEVDGPDPIVIITTNEERSLPNAFVRRCVVHWLEMPGIDAQDGAPSLVEWLVERGKAHFGRVGLDESVMQAAAEQLRDDRQVAIERGWSTKPGLAEFLDLLRALVVVGGVPVSEPLRGEATRGAGAKRKGKGGATSVIDVQMAWLNKLQKFVLQKHRDE